VHHARLIALLAFALCSCSAETPVLDAPDSGSPDAGALPGKLQVKWTLNGSDADHATACPANGITFFTLKVTLKGGTTPEFDVAADCVAGAWQSLEKSVPSGTYTVVLEAHSGTPFSGPLLTAVTKEIEVPATTLTTATVDLAVGTIQLNWTIDGKATNKATVCPAEGVTFWSASLKGMPSLSVGVDCVAGAWSATFKAVPAGSYTARVEAHSGTPFSGPLKLGKESAVELTAGGKPTTTIDFKGAEL